MRNVMGEILKFAENRGKDADILTSRLNQVFTPVAEMFGVPVDPQQPAQGAMPPQQPAQGAMPPQQPTPTQGGLAATNPALIQSESGGNWAAQNDAVGAGGNVGHFGRAQFGVARLDDAKRAGVIPPDMTPEQFMSDPNAQVAVEQWHENDIMSFAERNGITDRVGETVAGVPVTREGIMNVAHLGGNAGMRRFFESGGEYNPADANGTRLSDYLAMGAGQRGGSPVDDTYRNVADALDVNVSTSGTLDTNDRRNVESLLGEMLNDTVFDQEQADTDAAQWRKADLWTAFGTGIGQIGRGDAVDFSDIRNRAERRRNQNIELRMERARRAAGAQLALDMGDESMASAIAGGAADTNTLLTKRQQDLVNRRADEQITQQAAQAGYLASALEESGDFSTAQIEAIRAGVDPSTVLRVADMSRAANAAAARQEAIEGQLSLIDGFTETMQDLRAEPAMAENLGFDPAAMEMALQMVNLGGSQEIASGDKTFADFYSDALDRTSGGQQDQFTLSPGQTRFDAQGNPVAALDPAPAQSAGTETERAFQNAQNIAAQEGRLEEFNAEYPDGVLSFLETRSRGQGTGLTAQERFAPAVVDTDNLQASDSRISSDFDPTNVFGVYGVGTNIANTISEVLTGQLADPASKLAALDMDRLATTTLIDNAESVAGRPTNHLMQLFERLETRPTRVLTGPETARLSLQNQAAVVERGIQENNRILQSGAASEDMLEQAAAGNFRLGALLQDYRAALSAFDKAGVGAVDPAPEQDEAAFSDFDALRGALEAGEVEVGQVVVVNGKRYRARLRGRE